MDQEDRKQELDCSEDKLKGRQYFTFSLKTATWNCPISINLDSESSSISSVVCFSKYRAKIILSVQRMQIVKQSVEEVEPKYKRSRCLKKWPSSTDEICSNTNTCFTLSSHNSKVVCGVTDWTFSRSSLHSMDDFAALSWAAIV